MILVSFSKIHKGIKVTNFGYSCHIHVLSHPCLNEGVTIDQSDLQLYSMDKDLVDSLPKANQNLILFQNFPLGLNSNKASQDY